MYIYVIFWLISGCCSKTDGHQEQKKRREGQSWKLLLSPPPPPALTNNKRAITSPIKKRRLTKKRTCKRAHAFASRRPDQRGPLLETSGLRRFSLQRTSWGFHLSPSLTLCFHCYLLLFVGNHSLSLSPPRLLSPVPSWRPISLHSRQPGPLSPSITLRKHSLALTGSHA